MKEMKLSFLAKGPIRKFKLMEEQVLQGSSLDPLQDLATLVNHYQETFQWDRANAASRYMLALAEGKTDNFEIIAEDREIMESRSRLFNYKCKTRVLPLSLVLIGVIFVVCMLRDAYMYPEGRFGRAAIALFFADSRQVHYENAQKLHHQSDLAGALAEVDVVLRQDAHYPDANELKAWILLDLNEPDLALIQIDKADPRKPRYCFVKSEILYMLGRYRECAQMKESYVAFYPGDRTRNLLDAANAWRHASDYRRALALVKEAIQEGGCLAEMAECYAFQASLAPQADAAIDAASKAIGLRKLFLAQEPYPQGRDRDSIDRATFAYLHRANGYVEKGNTRAAISDLTVFLSSVKGTHEPEAYELRAKLYDTLGLHGRAAIDKARAEHMRQKHDQDRARTYHRL